MNNEFTQEFGRVGVWGALNDTEKEGTGKRGFWGVGSSEGK